MSFDDAPSFDTWDGRPRVDMIRVKETYPIKHCGDRLLAKLIEQHGKPRYDIASQLTDVCESAMKIYVLSDNEEEVLGESNEIEWGVDVLHGKMIVTNRNTLDVKAVPGTSGPVTKRLFRLGDSTVCRLTSLSVNLDSFGDADMTISVMPFALRFEISIGIGLKM